MTSFVVLFVLVIAAAVDLNFLGQYFNFRLVIVIRRERERKHPISDFFLFHKRYCKNAICHRQPSYASNSKVAFFIHFFHTTFFYYFYIKILSFFTTQFFYHFPSHFFYISLYNFFTLSK